MNALKELLDYLEEGEVVESIVFGGWGRTDLRPGPENLEPTPRPVTFGIQGIPLTFEDAKQYMTNWSFFGGFGTAEYYAVYI